MKKIFSIAAVLLLVIATIAFAVENGTATRNVALTLYSSATGTTGAVNSSAHTFDFPMRYLACDLISGVSSTTDNVTFTIDGNQGSSTTLFDSTPFLLTSTTLAGSTTASTMKTVRSASGVPAPFRTIRATITAPTTTQVVTINCSAIQ